MPEWLMMPVTRLRSPLILTAAAALVIASFTGPRWLVWTATALVAVGVVALFVPAAVPAASRRAAIRVRPPVTGRWTALNSPASRTPSHGTHAYAQTYAIDLVHEPGPGPPRPGLASWPLARRPEAFPGFGQPVLAPADGTVVKVSDWQRDHWSRTSWLALVVMLLAEATLRELTGPGRVLGNHIVIDLGDGAYALLAHLRRRSAVVTAGQRVAAGQQLAGCGNSGNSTEPHVHFQLMDRPGVLLASGLPFSFDGQPAGQGVPRTGQALLAPGTELT